MRYVYKETDDFDAVEFLTVKGFKCHRVGDAISFGNKDDLLDAKHKYPQCFASDKPIIALYDILQGDIVIIQDT